MTFMCNGLGNLDGNEGGNTGGGDDDVGVMAAMKKGMTRVDTTMVVRLVVAQVVVYTATVQGGDCNGLYNRGCAATSTF